ncbi:MAG TPA: hypothetical protein VEA36_03065, partial [Candidatus Paceibacterota bacterium]|nr:hypothetical protein [Candidatus Paceibacterota bacterium]
LSHPFPNITIDVVEAGGYCRMRDQTTGQPQKRVALLADLVFCPLSWAEQRCFRRFLDQCELQAAA